MMTPRTVTVARRPYNEQEIDAIMAELARSMSAGATSALRRSVKHLTNVDVDDLDWWEAGRSIFEDYVLTPIILDAMLDSSTLFTKVEAAVRQYGSRSYHAVVS